MRNARILVLISLITSFIIVACNSSEETLIETSVFEKLMGTWQSDSMTLTISVNGMKIDSLSQELAIDSLNLEFLRDSSYQFFVGKLGYTGDFRLERNDTKLIIDDFNQLVSENIPDSIDANVTTDTYIDDLTNSRLLLSSESEVSVLLNGGTIPLLLQVNTNTLFHRN